MSNLANPYEPPVGDASSASEPAVVRGHVAHGALHLVNGNTLVAEKGATLPPLCLWNGERCSEEAPSLRVVRIDERNVYIKLEPSAAAAFARAMAGD